MFVVDTVITLLDVVWDASRLLLVGTRATIVRILALLAAVAGTNLFLLSFPMYLVDECSTFKGCIILQGGELLLHCSFSELWKCTEGQGGGCSICRGGGNCS